LIYISYDKPQIMPFFYTTVCQTY